MKEQEPQKKHWRKAYFIIGVVVIVLILAYFVFAAITGVNDDEVILRDDFSNESGVITEQGLEYGSFGWVNLANRCSWTGDGYGNCTSDSTLTAYHYARDNTTTCKLNIQGTSVSDDGDLQFQFRNSSSTNIKCQVNTLGNNLTYRLSASNPVLLANVQNNTEYTIYMTYHTGNNTCEYLALQTSDNSINGSADGQTASAGSFEDYDEDRIMRDTGTARFTAIDYIFCWNGTISGDPSNILTSSVNITVQDLDFNFTMLSNQEVNITAHRIEGDSNIELYQDDQLINNDTSLVSNMTTLSLGKTYNFTVVHPTSAIYGFSFSSLFIEVLDFISNTTDPLLPSIKDSTFIISLEANNSFTGENITRMEINIGQPNGTLIADNLTMACVEISEDNHQLCNVTITHEKTIASVGAWTYNATVWKDGGENSSALPNTAFTVELPLSIDVLSPSNASTITTLTPTLNFTVGGGEYCTPTCFDVCHYNITRGASVEVATTNITCNTNVALSLSSDLTTYLLTVFVNDTNGNENFTTSTLIVDTTTGGGGGNSGGGGGGNQQPPSGSTGNCDVTLPTRISLSVRDPLTQFTIVNNQDASISTLISLEPPIGILEPDGKQYLSFPTQVGTTILPGQSINIPLELDTDALVRDNITTNQFARLKVPGASCDKFVPIEIDVGRGLDARSLLRKSLTALATPPSNYIILAVFLIAIGLVFRVEGLKSMRLRSKILFVIFFGFIISILIFIFINLFVS